MELVKYVIDGIELDFPPTYKVKTIGLGAGNPEMDFDTGPFEGHDAVAFRIPGLEGAWLVPFEEFEAMYLVARQARTGLAERDDSACPP